MTMVLLAVLGWFAVSILTTAAWASVCAGARKGAAENVAAWQRSGRVVPSSLPTPRTGDARSPLAV